MYTVKVTYQDQPDAVELWGPFKTREDANVFIRGVPQGPGKLSSVEQYRTPSDLANLALN